MLGSMLGIANLQTSELFGTGRDPVRLGSSHPMNAPYAGFLRQTATPRDPVGDRRAPLAMYAAQSHVKSAP